MPSWGSLYSPCIHLEQGESSVISPLKVSSNPRADLRVRPTLIPLNLQTVVHGAFGKHLRTGAGWTLSWLWPLAARFGPVLAISHAYMMASCSDGVYIEDLSEISHNSMSSSCSVGVNMEDLSVESMFIGNSTPWWMCRRSSRIFCRHMRHV